MSVTMEKLNSKILLPFLGKLYGSDVGASVKEIDQNQIVSWCLMAKINTASLLEGNQFFVFPNP